MRLRDHRPVTCPWPHPIGLIFCAARSSLPSRQLPVATSRSDSQSASILSLAAWVSLDRDILSAFCDISALLFPRGRLRHRLETLAVAGPSLALGPRHCLVPGRLAISGPLTSLRPDRRRCGERLVEAGASAQFCWVGCRGRGLFRIRLTLVARRRAPAAQVVVVAGAGLSCAFVRSLARAIRGEAAQSRPRLRMLQAPSCWRSCASVLYDSTSLSVARSSSLVSNRAHGAYSPFVLTSRRF